MMEKSLEILGKEGTLVIVNEIEKRLNKKDLNYNKQTGELTIKDDKIIPIAVPENAEPGQILIKSEEGIEWGDQVFKKVYIDNYGNYGVQLSDNTNEEIGSHAFSEGFYTLAKGNFSHAEGSNTKANGYASHTEGWFTYANGNNSHAEGRLTYANGDWSHTEGLNTYTYNTAEHASGQYNISTTNETLFSVGNGQNESNRHNAFEIKQNGDIYIPDTNASGNYYEKPMIKLQDALGNSGSNISLSFVPKQNEIIYTTTDGKALEYTLGNVVKSNEYFENLGYGKITFTEDLTDNLPERFFANKLTLKSIILPEGFTILPSDCFGKCYNLESVELPNSITEFNGSAHFSQCFRLKEINLPNEITEISYNCFEYCYSLNHIYLHDNIKKINTNAFYYSGISNINLNQVEEIGYNAFENSQLISLDTRNVKTIANNAFRYCDDLVTIYLSNSLESLGEYCFYSCKSLSNVNFVENSKLTTIQSNCFNGCTSLNEISIDSNINFIGGSAFYNCPLRSITIHSSSITNYNYAFTFNSSKSTLEYFYTKSPAPLQTMYAYTTLKTVVLDTAQFMTSLPNLGNLRNYCTIYVQEQLLEQYKTTYKDYANLFKPITGSVPGENTWTGTEEEYNLLGEYNDDTIYYIIDEDEL